MLKCEHCQGEHEESQRFCTVTGKLFAVERFFPSGMVLDGKYRLGDLIGTGGMGAVLEGTHLLLEKKVAIKLLLPDLAGDTEMTARLLREARAASASGHRNIALVTDLGQTSEGTLYVVMERLKGRSLDAVIKTEAPMPVPRAASIICQLLSGLDAVHRRGIMHRDLKPANIMLCYEEDGTETVKILDFGLSKRVVDQTTDLTTLGRVMGTPRYMSPEQARGAPDIDHRTDIHAAGALLYVLLTGKPPVDGKNYNAVLAAILDGEPKPPSKLVPVIPASLDAIVLRAMASAREQRFPDALSFRRELLPHCAADQGSTDLGVGGATSHQTPSLAPAVLAEPELVPLGEQPAPVPRAPISRRVEAPRPQSAFAPPVDDAPLELAEVPRPAPVHAAAPPQTMFGQAPQVPWRQIRRAVVLAIVIAAAAVAYHQREALQALLRSGAPASGPDQVMVLVETRPASAEVFIDGVFQVTRPVPLPRSDTRAYSVKVQAAGYITEERQIVPSRTQVLKVELRRRGRR